MLGLFAVPIVVATAFAHHVLQVAAPSNLLIARVRRLARPRAWQAAGLMAMAAFTLVAGHGLSIAITSGAPGWLNVLVLVLLWDAIKFSVAALLTFGHVSLRDKSFCAFARSSMERSHDHPWSGGPGVRSASASAAGTC